MTTFIPRQDYHDRNSMEDLEVDTNVHTVSKEDTYSPWSAISAQWQKASLQTEERPNRGIILRNTLYILLLVVVSSAVWLLRGHYDITHLSSLVSSAGILEHNPITPSSSSNPSHEPRYGFITFLNAYYPGKASPAEDIFFTNARMLTYQILHAPNTRVSSSPTNPNPNTNTVPIDMVVAVTSDVEPWKLERLATDGAIVKPIAKIPALGNGGMFMRWQDQFSKLEMFRLTEYDKLVYIDADTVLRESMEGIFWDTGAEMVQRRNVSDERMDEEGEMPERYMFASVDDLTGHGFQRRAVVGSSPVNDGVVDVEEEEVGGENERTSDSLQQRSTSISSTTSSSTLTRRAKRWRYFSGGFWMFKPDLSLYTYLYNLIPLHDGRFNPVFQEQNLLNYAFRREGPMPWAALSWKWNLWGPDARDWKEEIKSFHAHLWDPSKPEEQRKLWVDVRTEMEEFYAAREGREPPQLVNGLLPAGEDGQ